MNPHKHAIIIIKNKQDEYLQYYDERWNSYLFLNIKILENFTDQDITDHLTNKLKLSNNNLKCNYLTDIIHKKYSESAKKEKEYHHYFFNVDIEDIPSIIKQKEFSINNIKYSWYSIKELENDKRIKQVNSDIVNIVKELNNI